MAFCPLANENGLECGRGPDDAYNPSIYLLVSPQRCDNLSVVVVSSDWRVSGPERRATDTKDTDRIVSKLVSLVMF